MMQENEMCCDLTGYEGCFTSLLDVPEVYEKLYGQFNEPEIDFSESAI